MTNITQIEMTPEMAADILKRNPTNRHIKRSHVDLMARDMAAGDFQFNGDAIRLNGNGELIDGQHRLTACVKSGASFHTLLIRGLSSDVRATIDSGSKRTFADRLAMDGIASATAVASALRLAAGFANGEGRAIQLSHQEMGHLFDIHGDGITDSVRKTLKSFPRVTSAIAAIHYIGTATGNPGRADAWAGAWRSGVPDYDRCPVHKLRERLVFSFSVTGTTGKLTPLDTNRLMVKAWNHFVLRKGVSVLKAPTEMVIPGWTKKELWAEG